MVYGESQTVKITFILGQTIGVVGVVDGASVTIRPTVYCKDLSSYN